MNKRYYCKNCESKIETKFTQTKCPYCSAMMDIVPDYETPEQYEKRTGKPYPDDGLVWIIDSPFPVWGHGKLEAAKFSSRHFTKQIVVIADPPVPPPNDWRPE